MRKMCIRDRHGGAVKRSSGTTQRIKKSHPALFGRLGVWFRRLSAHLRFRVPVSYTHLAMCQIPESVLYNREEPAVAPVDADGLDNAPPDRLKF